MYLSAEHELYEDKVKDLARLVTLHHPLGWEELDRAWTLLRERRPDTPPEECPMTRKLLIQLEQEIRRLTQIP